MNQFRNRDAGHDWFPVPLAGIGKSGPWVETARPWYIRVRRMPEGGCGTGPGGMAFLAPIIHEPRKRDCERN